MVRDDAYIPDIVPESDVKMFEKGNMGHRVGFGEKIAVVVVDMSRAFVEDRFPLGNSKNGVPAAKAIRKLLDEARPMGLPIFFTTGSPWIIPCQGGRWLDKGTASEEGSPMRTPEAHEIVDIIKPAPGEVLIVKAKPSAFFGTQLPGMLTYHNIDTLIVTGMVTSGCVRATVIDAFSYNYRVIIPLECVADRGEISHKVNLFDMDMKYADVMPLGEVLSHLGKIRMRGAAKAAS